MNIYLDDNSSDLKVAGALKKANHTAVRPVDASLSGAPDARHLEYAIRSGLVLMTKDTDDFLDLHQLVLTSGGSHCGILLVHQENDPSRDMKPNQIAAAVSKLEKAGLSLQNQAFVLNHWR